MNNFKIPSCQEFNRGCAVFQKQEPRDTFYKVATWLISDYWSRPEKIAAGLSILLMTWNQAFYRYGWLDEDKLEKFVKTNKQLLNDFRKRNLLSFSEKDIKAVKQLFNGLLEATKLSSGKQKGRRSPVSVAKTLHLLAPDFFPIWDVRIARAYNSLWINSDQAAEKYIKFCWINKELIEKMKPCVRNKKNGLLKLIDEYNYAKYTKKWI
jgi:hypothetical protein